MINPVSFQSIPIINTPERRQNAVKIAAPTLITSSAVMLATRAPKGSVNQLKMSTRLARAGIAGLATAAVVSALTLVNKDTVVQGVNKVKEIFRRNPAEKELDNAKPIEANIEDAKLKEELNTGNASKPQETSANPFAENIETKPEEGLNAPKLPAQETNTNPFAENNQVKELDGAINDAENLVNQNPKQEPTIPQIQTTPANLQANITNPFAALTSK